MKVAHFIGMMRRGDGVAHLLLELISEANKRGIESVIVTGGVEDGFAKSIKIINVPSVKFILYKGYRIPLAGIKGFKKELDEFGPDILFIFIVQKQAGGQF